MRSYSHTPYSYGGSSYYYGGGLGMHYATNYLLLGTMRLRTYLTTLVWLSDPIPTL